MKVTDDDIRHASIMVVDDSMVSLRNMEEILKKDGFYQVHTVSDPTEVTQLYEQIQPALIILDYHMPEMTGMEVLEKLNKKYPDRPRNVLFWTSESEEVLLEKALKMGAQDVLRKDEIEPVEIHCRVRNLVRIRLSARKIERQNERLRERVQEQTQRIREVSLESISRLSQAAEFRDNETGAHIQRIGRLTSKLAELLGMDESTCEAIQYASTMHDIGKVMVPDEILFKHDVPVAPADLVTVQEVDELAVAREEEVEAAIEDWERRAVEREREQNAEMVDRLISEHRAGERGESD